MKTVNKIIITLVVLVVIGFTASISKRSVKEIQSSLNESTHQGYRTMVSDFIF